MIIARTLATVLMALTAQWLLSGDAQAQCSGSGDPMGSCPTGLGFEGCCDDPSTVSWCESGTWCTLDCGGNVGSPTNPPCQTSYEAGSCDTEITACVCGIDSLCCDPTVGWDSYCVGTAINDCGGCGSGVCDPPATSCGWLDGEGFYDCRPFHSADPSGNAPATCSYSGGCVADCAGRTCGDDGCGGVCGTCGPGESCSAGGQCISDCTPSCSGRVCGSDGCSGVCGTCGPTQACNGAGQCETVCTRDCAGKTCGDDGCGDLCGSCSQGQACQSGQCVSGCTPNCNGKICGDNGCGGSCGSCPVGSQCDAQQRCEVVGCVADCTGRLCGDDGCGGSCGSCPTGEGCEAGVCETVECTCVGRSCGDDGCGRACGFCGPGTVCNDATYQCGASTPTQPDPTPDTSGGGTDVTTEACPAGQTWSQYAQACVAGGTPLLAEGDDTGCSGGGGSMPGLLLALLGVLALLSRRGQRGRSMRVPTR